VFVRPHSTRVFSTDGGPPQVTSAPEVS
jgi:hypothetical protein